MYWYKKAAEQGYGPAYLELGADYKYHKKDRYAAIYWYKKYADYKYDETGKVNSDVIESLKELGVDYDPSVQRSSGNMAQTRAELQEQADAGDAEAQYKLGKCYDLGKSEYYGEINASRDVDKAIYWYKKAAEQGYGNAYFDLALIYRHDKKDKEEAINWYKKSADYNYVEYGYTKSAAVKGLKELRVKYNPSAQGLSSKVAYTRAELQERAEAGDAEAQYKLGECYNSGRFICVDKEEKVRMNLGKAIYWFKKAAAQGYGDAYFSLALIYEINIEDKDEAIYWYKKDADHWYEKYGDLDGIAIENLKELGVDYDPRTKRSRSTADASDGSSRRSSGSTFDYTMSKGEVVIPKVYNNGGGYGGYDSGSSNYSPGVHSSGSTGSSSTSRRQCSLCHGTGRIVHENYTATYGNDRKMRCNECGKDYWASSGHSHITCTQCHGKGYF